MPVIEAVEKLQDQMQEWRRDIHRHPEMGMDVGRTAGKVSDLLQSWGIEVHRICETGIVGVLHGQGGPGGKSVLLRADMDALRLDEKTGADHASQTQGVMHACGHDGHTVMLLGAAKHLSQTRDFHGTVYFLFQPAEEGLDGANLPASGGAEHLIKNGLLEQFPCDEVYAIHNFPQLPKGYFLTSPGPLLAACDEFRILFKSSGGHASRPEETGDVLLAGAEAVLALKSYEQGPLKEIDPAALLGICSAHAGTQSLNVLPESGWLGGTPRFLNVEVRDALKKALGAMAQEIAAKHGVEAELNYTDGYPVLVNTQGGVDNVVAAAVDIVGTDAVIPQFPPQMGAEDFAFFLQKKPGALIALGIAEEGRVCGPIHSPTYDFNDAAAPLGASFWVRLVERCLPLASTASGPQACAGKPVSAARPGSAV